MRLRERTDRNQLHVARITQAACRWRRLWSITDQGTAKHSDSDAASLFLPPVYDLSG